MFKRGVGTFLIFASWSMISHALNPFSEGDFVSVPGLEGIEVQKHELTYGQYEGLHPALPAENQSPWDADDCLLPEHIKTYGSNFPAACVSWNDANNYAAALNGCPFIDTDNYAQTLKAQQDCTDNKITAGKQVYRLPTDDELKSLVKMTLKSLKAGAVRVSDSALQSHAWYVANSNGKAHEVCTKQTVHGLCDVLGNLWEWTSTSANGSDRFLCGGGWYDAASVLRDAYSDWYGVSERYGLLGVRLVRTLKE